MDSKRPDLRRLPPRRAERPRARHHSAARTAPSTTTPSATSAGVDFKPAEDFPADDVGYGFDNIGDVLSFQPILLEKYLAAADKILAKSLFIPEPLKRDKQTFRPQNIIVTPRSAKSKEPVQDRRSHRKAKRSSTNTTFQRTANTQIRIKGWGTKVGGEFPKVTVRVGREDVKDVHDRCRTKQGRKVYEVTAKLLAGEKQVRVAFTNGFQDKDSKRVTYIWPGQHRSRRAVQPGAAAGIGFLKVVAHRASEIGQ